MLYDDGELTYSVDEHVSLQLISFFAGKTVQVKPRKCVSLIRLTARSIDLSDLNQIQLLAEIERLGLLIGQSEFIVIVCYFPSFLN